MFDGLYYNEKDDPVSAHLFALDGTKWKDLRGKFTPTFTSSKMKMMIHTMFDISKCMSKALGKCAMEKEDIDIKK
ncbi:hypothetical protein NQ314_014749, partial [Rhamnusium bicolor]